MRRTWAKRDGGEFAAVGNRKILPIGREQHLKVAQPFGRGATAKRIENDTGHWHGVIASQIDREAILRLPSPPIGGADNLVKEVENTVVALVVEGLTAQAAPGHIQPTP